MIKNRGQEMFNVALMGFCNSVPYAQRQMDLLLKEFAEFYRAYLDDIILGADTFERWLVVILPMSLWRSRSSIILYNDNDTQNVLPRKHHFCSRYSIY